MDYEQQVKAILDDAVGKPCTEELAYAIRDKLMSIKQTATKADTDIAYLFPLNLSISGKYVGYTIYADGTVQKWSKDYD